MNRLGAIAGSALFLVVAPGTIAAYVPWTITHWRVQTPFLGIDAVPAIGILLVIAALPGLLDSFARFALQGLGTPSPIAPPKRLVVSGFYRFVRNPMYVSVLGLIFGQALLFGSTTLLAYGAIVWLLFHLFVCFYEEPVLRRSFGDEYRHYCERVPRWIPHLRPPEGGHSGS